MAEEMKPNEPVSTFSTLALCETLSSSSPGPQDAHWVAEETELRVVNNVPPATQLGRSRARIRT